MNLWQLQVFQAIVQHGSLQVAANQLHRTAPALSMSLNKLEQDLGFQLFTRDGYRLQLTAQGRQFHHHSYELLLQYQRLESFTQQLREGAEHSFEIAFESACHPNLLSAALRHVQQAYPATDIVVTGESQLNTLKRVQHKQVLLGLTPWLAVFQQQADFDSVFVAEYQLTVVVARERVEHLAANGLTRAHLQHIPAVLPQHMDMGIEPEQIFRGIGSARIRVNDVNTMLSMVRTGVGWGIVPRQFVATDLKNGRLIEVNVAGMISQVHAEVRLVKLAGSVLGPAAQALWDFYQQQQALK